MRACFADNAELPITCAHDIDEVYNCCLAQKGVQKICCKHWQPARAIKLAAEIVGFPEGVFRAHLERHLRHLVKERKREESADTQR